MEGVRRVIGNALYYTLRTIVKYLLGII